MAMSHCTEHNKHQQNDDNNDDDNDDDDNSNNNNNDAQSFSAAFAEVPVPDDILQQRAVNQDKVEAKIAARDNYREAEDRVEQNAIGDAVGQDGDPFLWVIATTGATSTILVELVERHILQC
jgi:hypothetical protein